MSMNRKQGKRLLAALIGTFLLLVFAAGLFLFLYLRVSSAGRETAEELESARSELAALQEEKEKLEKQLGEAQEAAAAAEAERDEALAQAEAAKQEPPLGADQEDEAPLLDVSELEAGTIIEADRLDFENLEQYFASMEIEEGGDVYQRIYGRSYVDNPNISLGELRYFKLLHYNFDHEIQVGELIANADLEEDYLEIFQELFENEYEIQSMYLIDNYWTGDGESSDSASIEVNNTSAFCYREVTGGGGLSNHAFGRAIDINPQQNPYVSYSSGYPVWSHSNADDYIDRTTGYDHVITHEDLCYQIFTAHGFTWGGDWSNPKDYQHFEKEG